MNIIIIIAFQESSSAEVRQTWEYNNHDQIGWSKQTAGFSAHSAFATGHAFTWYLGLLILLAGVT